MIPGVWPEAWSRWYTQQLTQVVHTTVDSRGKVKLNMEPFIRGTIFGWVLIQHYNNLNLVFISTDYSS